MEVNGNMQQKSLAKTPMISRSPMMTAFLAGSFSGVCSTVLFQPLDLIKTRIQTRPSEKQPLTMASAARSVLRSEGVLGLWRGLGPSLARTVPGVGLYFTTAHTLRSRLASGSGSSSLGPGASLLVGFVSRSVACTALIPVTVLKLRSEVETKVAASITDIYRVEGARGLTRGLLPTILRDAPFSGLYMMMYDMIRSAEWNKLDSALMNGLMAGFLASLVTHPMDVVKTKMQLQTRGTKTLVRACSRILIKYGPRGFFLGLGPRLIRRSLMAGLAWSVYESAMKTLGIK